MVVCLSSLVPPKFNVRLYLPLRGWWPGVSDREKVFLVEMMKTLDVVNAAIDPREFFTKYVQTRTPVVIKGHIQDEGFQASRWVRVRSPVPYLPDSSRCSEKTDLEYLSKKAGHVTVQVEPIHPDSKQFGTDLERVEAKFSEFLDGLKQEDGERRYLTTQYSEDSEGGLDGGGEKAEEGITTYPPPTNTLRDDFPSAPKIAGNLVLQQVNLWIGRSKNGASSGLVWGFCISTPRGYELTPKVASRFPRQYLLSSRGSQKIRALPSSPSAELVSSRKDSHHSPQRVDFVCAQRRAI